ncbi:MAG: type II secretion system protein [Armatimonadetes bacterium]|nr:type II secretion system protein [Armatimonadota bacterium]
MSPRCGAKRGGFTLIELLVVIAIISILASILMPAFARARESARKIVCVSNLHQLASAIDMYVQDHDGYYPIAWAFWAPAMTPPQPMYPNLKSCIQPYVKDHQVWWCKTWEGKYGRNAWRNPNGSGYDFIVPSTDPSTGMPLSFEVIGAPRTATSWGSCWAEATMQSPSTYPLLFCGSHWTRSLNAHSGTSDYFFFNAGSVGGTNIAYADGHVKWEPLDSSKWDRIYRTPR